MRALPSFLASLWPSGRARRRAMGVLFALLLEALVLLVLLTFSPIFTRKHESTLIAFGIEQGKGEQNKASQREKAKQQPQKKQVKSKQPQQKQQPDMPKPLDDSALPPSIIRLSRNDFAASDISHMQHAAGGATSQQEADAETGESDSEIAHGHGPHGEILYRAEWYRHPTQTELSAYITDRMRGLEGTGIIECRTIPDFKVDDCQILDDSPPGSGFGYAVLQAAWQFRVRPPRVGGKLLVGKWVAIEIDYRVDRIRVR